MSKKSYYEKLKDPRWQRKRLEALDFYDFKCELCGSEEVTLHVHHKEYFKNIEPWDYDIRQLAVLCEDCHDGQHEIVDELKWVCSMARIDGPQGRKDAAVVLAGFLLLDFDEFIEKTGTWDIPYHRFLFETGFEAAQKWDKTNEDKMEFKK